MLCDAMKVNTELTELDLFENGIGTEGALAIADLVKTSLGPKGMDKILQSVGRGNAVSVSAAPLARPPPGGGLPPQTALRR